MKTNKHLNFVFFFVIVHLGLQPILANFSNNLNEIYYKDLSLTGSFEVTDTYCGACNGALDLTITGGEMPYTYTWGDGETTEDLENLCIGVYNVTVLDASGCSFEGSSFVGSNNVPDVILETQAEVDAYVANNSFCSTVNGNLRIGTTFSAPPSNITDISGLSFITSVSGSLLIFQNHNLTSLNGLQNITSLGAALNITNNNGLTNLIGLPSLTTINGQLTIDNCSSLVSLDGLNQITSTGGNKLYLSNTPSLLNLSGLSQLETVNGDLDIRICLDLINLNGLEGLSYIGGDLILQDNLVLNDISALDHPIDIQGNLMINNTELSSCSVLSICNMLMGGATANLSNNNAGCNTEEEISLGCTVSVDEFESKSNFKIYPNPIKDRFFIQYTGARFDKSPYTIWNTSGVLVQSGELFHLGVEEESIELENCETGLYILKIEIGNDVIVERLVVR